MSLLHFYRTFTALLPHFYRTFAALLPHYSDSRHCSAARFEIWSDFPELTRCDCSICKRKNALMVKVHEFTFVLPQGADTLSKYQFHTCIARHYFCSVCGIYPFHRKRVTPDFYGIDVACLENFDPAGIPIRMAIGAGMI